jgi:hypothetical protein
MTGTVAIPFSMIARRKPAPHRKPVERLSRAKHGGAPTWNSAKLKIGQRGLRTQPAKRPLPISKQRISRESLGFQPRHSPSWITR